MPRLNRCTLAPPAAPWHLQVYRAPRARRVALRYCPLDGLQLRLPPRVTLAQGLQFALAQRDWVAALERRHGVDLSRPPAAPALPRALHLAALGEHWAVAWDVAAAPGVVQSDRRLQLGGPPRPAALALQRWLIARARATLGPWLADCARRSGLHYRRLAVRNQHSRWGSYASSGTLSLNCRLLLLEPALVEYVLWHELAHVRHLDHSAAFWQLLEQLCPGARARACRLERAGRELPAWLSVRRGPGAGE